MSETPLCELCGQRPVEFEIRKISDKPKGVFHRSLCKNCLSTVLADDTASILRISRPGAEEGPSTPN